MTIRIGYRAAGAILILVFGVIAYTGKQHDELQPINLKQEDCHRGCYR